MSGDDKQRRDHVLNTIRSVWSRFPHLRLCQLLWTASDFVVDDPYYIGDAALLVGLKKAAKRFERHKEDAAGGSVTIETADETPQRVVGRVLMTERPILFSTPLVRAILDGRKSQTRRPVKPQPPAGFDRHCWFDRTHLQRPTYGWTPQEVPAKIWHTVPCPYGCPGDRLWVRETHRFTGGAEDAPLQSVRYRADLCDSQEQQVRSYSWRPSIHMPRWASRITLEVTRVRVERVQDISVDDAIAEGAERDCTNHSGGPYGCTDCMNTGFVHDPRGWFAWKWDQINKKRGFGWDTNPWVWVVEFRRVHDE